MQSNHLRNFQTVFILPFCLLLLFFCGDVFSKDLVLEESKHKYPLGKYVEYLEDIGKNISIDDLVTETSAATFIQSTQMVPGFGFTASAYWFRLTIVNPFIHDAQHYLEIKNPYIDKIDFYRQNDSGEWIEKSTGELFPFESRDIKNSAFFFRIHLSGQSKKVFFIRFEGDSSLDVPLILYDEEGFQQKLYQRTMDIGFYLGIIFIMMLTSLFLFFQLKDLSLFYYFLYLATQPLIYSKTKSFLGEYIWSGYHIWSNQGFIVFYSLSHICFLLFTRSFLETHKHLKTLDRILIVEIAILSVGIIPGIFVSYKIAAQFLITSIMFYHATVLLAGILCLFKSRKSAYYFLLAFTPMIASRVLIILMKLNFIDNSRVIVDFFQVSHFIQLALLSIAIIGRVKILYDDKQIALEKAINVKDDFLAKTSHELRTPLHGIIGITESLVDTKSTIKLPQSVQGQLNIIMASARRLASLVNDILDVSKLKNQDIQLNKKSLDFYQITEIVLFLCRPLTTGKDLILINKISKNLPPVHGDEDRVQQIMHNLIGNAIKFTPKGEIVVTARIKNKRVIISIHDEGIGIPENKRESIFTNFEQINSTDKNFTQGAGLGLSIVKQLVELHGGTVKVTSNLGSGSTFAFDLPLSSSPIEQFNDIPLFTPQYEPEQDVAFSYNYSEIDSRQSNFNILVVDDEPINLQVVTNHLAQQGFNIQAAASGEEALLVMEHTTPHLILLDVMMPGMSGFELCKKIRKDHSKTKMVIIFLTARNQVNDLVEGFFLGANDYIRKPFSRNELLTRVNYHLENHLMANRLVSLTEFSVKINHISDLQVIFRGAFKLICEQISLDYGVLIFEKKILAKEGKLADKQAIDSVLSSNNDGDEVSFHHFHTYELIQIQPNSYRDCTIIILKEDHGEFSKLEIEFIRNILSTIKITRDNLREMVSDPKLLSGLNQIRENLTKIIYIKSQRNYCSIICEDSISDSFELRISIQKIQTFFQESELLKISRSILVNPSKVKSIQKMAKQKYILEMVNRENLPISRSMEKPVRNYFHRN